MKHGYYVMGIEDGREFTYGKCDTKAQVRDSYLFAMNAHYLTDKVKKSLRIVELVEKDITEEILHA